MHVPDGFLDVPTCVAAGGVAVAGVAWCLRRAERDLDERLVPVAGLTAAFVFAVQMLNFPVLPGVSGHLLGGVLAASLVGPAVGALCVTVVLLVQMLFSDGGVTALGVNVSLLALLTVAGGWAATRALLGLLPARAGSVPIAAGLAAAASVPLAALAFTGLYAVGGTTEIPLTAVLVSMGGVHALIGIGEGLITAATLSAVLGARPDLVHVARHLRARPERLAAPVLAGQA